jgi:hypothetical protein
MRIHAMMPNNETREVSLMLPPKSHDFDFSAAGEDLIRGHRLELFDLLRADATDEAAATP